MKVVGIGGGTGLPVLLSGLKRLRQSGECDIRITAVVAVSDSGGSTGNLRAALGIPAMGDLRNCFIALAGSPLPVLKAVCRHRFHGIEGLSGHSMGNLILSALYQMAGDFDGMVRLANHLFQLKDRVLPGTSVPVTLCADFFDGSIVRGESAIPLKRMPIRRVWLDPERPLPAPGVLDAIAEADAIVFGPGSLYTSVIPSLLVAGVADAIHASSAVKIHVCNLMTQAGETGTYTAADHLRALTQYLPSGAVDVCVVNTRSAGPLLQKRYSQSGAQFVTASDDEIRRLGAVPQRADLLQENNTKIRHDGLALARLVVALGSRRREWEVLCAES